MPVHLRSVSAALAAAAAVGLLSAGGPALAAAQSDLDAFMAQVLAHRDENWKKLRQYVLDERERVDVTGPGAVPIWGDQRTYTWYIRSGLFVRSPVTANGVTISESERRKYEDEFLARARKRESKEGEAASAPAAPTEAGDLGGLLAQSRQPGFIDSAYFLRFKFEEGKYALVGREAIDGVDVLRIEYYPARLFSHEQDDQDRRRAERRNDRNEDVEAKMETLMNKVALVTLWVTPDTRQIVRYTFDNVHMDFLPAAWLVRVNDVTATMNMSQPFRNVWLPRDVDMRASTMLAVGSVGVRYRLSYTNYHEAVTEGRMLPLGAAPAP